MIGYSEVLQTIAAMVLFSLILMTSNKMILLNSQKEVESEAEQKAITIAQTYIDEARILAFDDNTATGSVANVPEDFTNCGPESGETNRASFNDFDDYHNWSELIDWSPGDQAFQVGIEVKYVSPPDYELNDGHTGLPYTEYKKMTVTVNSDYLKDANGHKTDITLSYLYKYYKQQ